MKKISTLCLHFLILFCCFKLQAYSVNENADDGAGLALLSMEFAPFLNDTIINLDDTLKFELDNCSDNVDICINVPITDISNYQITNNGQPYGNGIAGCDFDTVSLYSYTNLFGQGSLGPYILQSWVVNGSIFSAPFNSINELVDSMNIWDPLGNWVHDDPGNLITGGASGNTYSDMVIWVVIINSPNTLTHNENFVAQGTELNFSVGNNQVVVTDNNSGCSDSVVVQIACLITETFNDNVIVGQSGTQCLDFGELIGEVSSVTNICAGTSNVDFQLINSDSCVLFTSLQVGRDTACYVACDVFGFCDTTYLIIDAMPATGTHEFYDTIYNGEANTFCINTSVFGGTPDTIYNICETSSGTYANFNPDENTFCVDYSGVSFTGTDTACIVVCDDLMACDTSLLYITVRRLGPNYLYDTILINESVTDCDLDLSNLMGTPVSMTNGCAGMSGTDVFFDLDAVNYCITYDGIGAGKDTACVYITDDMGFVDTTFAIVCVVAPSAALIYDTIRLEIDPVYCPDTTELFGNIVSIENICPDESGNSIDFTVNATTFCVEGDAFMAGTDTACIVLCDDLGACDTTTYIVTVEEEDPELPIAVNDCDSTSLNTEIIVDACANDSIPVNLPFTNFFVLPMPLGGVGPVNGVVFSNNDCTVSYTPDLDYCGLDSLSYVICNPVGCDTAQIKIKVICPPDEFKIFNAFSPNGDDFNDYFRISGIEGYPNHLLIIYNRWGNEVLRTENYNNDWDARWNGVELPDGTYFYIFNDGEGTTHTGYVYLTR